MIELYKGDCLEVMKTIPDNSIDAIITDPPYGTTACKWDSVIDFTLMWEQLNRIIKPNGAIVLFGSQPFTSALIMSNVKKFKYELIWEKNIPSGFFNAKKQQMKIHENIAIFSNGKPTYNPQMVLRSEEEYKKTLRINDSECFNADVYGGGRKKLIRKTVEEQKYKYPFTICEYNIDRSYGFDKHPTKKPIALMEYLIKTYTNDGETVLDFTFGSCSTGIACLNTNRKFIGIEMDDNYFSIGVERIKKHEKVLDNTHIITIIK
jgi:DNA modification methylase